MMQLRKRNTWILATLAALAWVSGCGQPLAEFRTNLVYIEKFSTDEEPGLTAAQKQDLANVLAAAFGTPDDPVVVNVAGASVSDVLDIDRLQMAAGAVHMDAEGRPQGLYREHCVHCHGITGDGAGPTAAFLNPYPRDFRKGVFKFKSTPGVSKPTDADLMRTLMEGIPGTAMPSFRLLPGDELDAVLEYVKYLSIRGEVERRLIQTGTLEGPDFLFSENLLAVADEIALVVGDAELVESGEALGTWVAAASEATPIPQKPDDWDLAASVKHGRELFLGKAGCVKCHGETAIGDGELGNFDDWTDELEPKKPERVAAYVERGALEPRNLVPRNLRMGVYRGGRRPIDIYRRIYNGIGGAKMPAQSNNVMKEGDPHDPKKMTQDEIWNLVDYVRSLPYESISRPREHQPQNQRERS